jgi:uncharacterized glyoxalase superfamily protein PhnB
MTLDYVPEGQQCVAPYLIVPDAEMEIEFLRQVFDAEPVHRATGGAGGIHAEVRIGDTVVMLGQPPGGASPQPANLHAYVADVDRTYQRALEAGAVDATAPTEQPFGGRRASFTDPAGHCWWVATVGDSAAT